MLLTFYRRQLQFLELVVLWRPRTFAYVHLLKLREFGANQGWTCLSFYYLRISAKRSFLFYRFVAFLLFENARQTFAALS